MLNIEDEKNKQEQKPNNKHELARAFALLSQLGITMAVTIGLSLGIGYFLDQRFETTPIFIFIFIIFGIGASIRNMLHLLKK